MSGDILHDIDAAIEEHEGYVEWHGSEDAATWTADGSHEVDTGGHYYAEDGSQVWAREYARSWREFMHQGSTLISATGLDRSEAADRSRRMFQAWDEVTLGQLRAYQEQINRMHRNHRAFTATFDAIVDEAGRFYWQRLTEPDPAEFVRETVATWQPGEVPARPIEAVLREIVREQG